MLSGLPCLIDRAELEAVEVTLEQPKSHEQIQLVSDALEVEQPLPEAIKVMANPGEDLEKQQPERQKKRKWLAILLSHCWKPLKKLRRP